MFARFVWILIFVGATLCDTSYSAGWEGGTPLPRPAPPPTIEQTQVISTMTDSEYVAQMYQAQRDDIKSACRHIGEIAVQMPTGGGGSWAVPISVLANDGRTENQGLYNQYMARTFPGSTYDCLTGQGVFVRGNIISHYSDYKPYMTEIVGAVRETLYYNNSDLVTVTIATDKEQAIQYVVSKTKLQKRRYLSIKLSATSNRTHNDQVGRDTLQLDDAGGYRATGTTGTQASEDILPLAATELYVVRYSNKLSMRDYAKMLLYEPEARNELVSFAQVRGVRK